PDFVRMHGEKIGEHFRASARENGVIGGVARKIWRWKQRSDAWIKLRRAEIPVSELAVLAGDERIVEHGRDQRINASDSRRVLLQLVFGDPFVGVVIGPGIEARRALPPERLPVGGKSAG